MGAGHTLILGGTKGLSRALVDLLYQEGKEVSLAARHAPASGRGKTGPRFHPVDLSDLKALPAALKAIVRRTGKLSHLVFFQRYRGAGDPWAGELDVSLSATKTAIETLAGHFDGRDNSIVIVGSVNATLITPELPASYHVAKSGLVQLVRYYAVALGPKGIRVNSVSPGTVLKEESKDFHLKNKRLQDLYKKISPLGRMGTAEELARVIRFLSGPESSYLTGQDIVLDGGMSLQWQEALARKVAGV
jgi:NAD(P)-dependent dehydrogenase (short-subunit alcohol dehydrogenase family)